MEKYGIPQSLLPGKAYINGTWVSEKTGKTFKVLNPATGELLGEVPDLGAAETEEAIGVAYKTFQTWKETTAKVGVHNGCIIHTALSNSKWKMPKLFY